MKAILSKLVVIGVLSALTMAGYGACFHGWFLPKPLDKPVSLRDGSQKARTHGLGYYFLGRRHYGGGYGRGK